MSVAPSGYAAQYYPLHFQASLVTTVKKNTGGNFGVEYNSVEYIDSPSVPDGTEHWHQISVYDHAHSNSDADENHTSGSLYCLGNPLCPSCAPDDSQHACRMDRETTPDRDSAESFCSYQMSSHIGCGSHESYAAGLVGSDCWIRCHNESTAHYHCCHVDDDHYPAQVSLPFADG